MSITELIEFGGSGWDGVYEIKECRRALSPSGLPGIDYALNPYGGCEHGCIYCYAPEVTHSDWDGWRVVKVRSNIADRLAKEIQGLSGTVGIGTVTDPYQYAEARFGLTVACLEILSKKDLRFHIHTKSDLILRDLELLSRMKGEVGVTITSVDDRISKITEPGAPLPAFRLKALEGLVDYGIDAYALVGPILTHLEGKESEFVDAVASTGVRRMFLDSLNSRPLLSDRMMRKGISGSNVAKERIRRLGEAAGLDVKDVF